MTRAAKEGAEAADGSLGDDELEAIERQHVEQVARAHAALAEAQDRSYWLDRWGVDLNAWMRRRGASELRAAVRALRGGLRLAIKARRQAKGKAIEARREMAAERDQPDVPEAAPKIFGRSLSPKPLEAAPATERVFRLLDEAHVGAL